MHRYTGRWTARVEQDFDIEAETEAEARAMLDDEMNPRKVVELIDFEVTEFEEVSNGEEIDE